MHEILYAGIAIEAFRMVIERQRAAPGLVHHLDRGIQYAADAFAAIIVSSMSRKAATMHHWRLADPDKMISAQLAEGSYYTHAQGRAHASPDPCESHWSRQE
jgi:hypothetical protein